MFDEREYSLLTHNTNPYKNPLFQEKFTKMMSNSTLEKKSLQEHKSEKQSTETASFNYIKTSWCQNRVCTLK